jgi:hypothetical protein
MPTQHIQTQSRRQSRRDRKRDVKPPPDEIVIKQRKAWKTYPSSLQSEITTVKRTLKRNIARLNNNHEIKQARCHTPRVKSKQPPPSYEMIVDMSAANKCDWWRSVREIFADNKHIRLYAAFPSGKVVAFASQTCYHRPGSDFLTLVDGTAVKIKKLGTGWKIATVHTLIRAGYRLENEWSKRKPIEHVEY